MIKMFWLKFCQSFRKSYEFIGNLIFDLLGKVSGFLIWLSLILFALTIFFNYISPPIATLYRHFYTISEFGEEKISEEDKKKIDHLIAKNHIIPMSSIHESTLSYYDSLISILIALLGVFALASWFSLRSKAKDEAGTAVEKLVDSRLFQSWLDEHLNRIVQGKISDFEANVEAEFGDWMRTFSEREKEQQQLETTKKKER